MNNFTHRRQLLPYLFTVAIGLFAAFSSTAQIVRAYGSPIFSDNLKGGHTLFGNTIQKRGTSATGMTSWQTPTSSNGYTTSAYDNDNENMVWVDVDADAGTFNSSSADLVLPAGTNTVKFARLYWGGRINNNAITANDANLKTVKIRKGNDSYMTIINGQVDKSSISGTTTAIAYQGYYDVTTFVNANGPGSYTIADVAGSTGSVGSGGSYGGWSMVVVYENANRSYSSVRIYDGFLNVQSNSTQTITLTGLNAPGTPVLASDAYMSTMAWEGDGDLGATSGNPSGDFMEINNVKVTNALNPAQNFWNGTISKNGAHVTSKFPDYINQLGIDIDEIEVGAGYNISPNSTEVSVTFGTEADQYFPSVFAFTMATKPPLVELNKTGEITGPGSAQKLLYPNQTITYTISGKNSGGGDALQAVITDTLPFGLTYVPNSLRIISSPGGFEGPKTDAQGDDQAFTGSYNSKTYFKYYVGTGATHNSGGKLQPSQEYSVEFKCSTPINANPSLSISNTARITGVGVSGEAFVDDGTFLFGPGNITLAVKLVEFKVSLENNQALLKWTTSGELKNDRFEIERSTDGVNFTKIGTLNGNGTTSEEKNYQFADALPANASIAYYRLKDIDINGKGSYSKIVALRLNGLTTLNNFTVYPNPFTSAVKMQISSKKETVINVRISNSAGQQEISRSVTVQPGENIVVIQNLESLKPGMHLVEIISEDGKVVQKLMKK